MRTTLKATGLLALTTLLAATADTTVAVAQPSPVEADQSDGSLRWVETPSATVGPQWSAKLRESYHVFPVRRLEQPVNRITATVSADTPGGSKVEVEVRAVTPAGRWTEWQPVSTERTAPFSTTRIQVRVVLTPGTANPTVSGVSLTAGTAPATKAAPAAAPTYRIPATREGLVGRTTANGHVIRPNDHFVALPSRRALNANDQTRDYKVRVCNPRNGKCVEEPVWDVGPWNTRDDYWNPSNIRENWRDLPQGKPEATAAYYQDYNNGRDQFGRQVSNPSGIDLADGTWASLGMTGNDVVDVTYLWKEA